MGQIEMLGVLGIVLYVSFLVSGLIWWLGEHSTGGEA